MGNASRSTQYGNQGCRPFSVSQTVPIGSMEMEGCGHYDVLVDFEAHLKHPSALKKKEEDERYSKLPQRCKPDYNHVRV